MSDASSKELWVLNRSSQRRLDKVVYEVSNCRVGQKKLTDQPICDE